MIEKKRNGRRPEGRLPKMPLRCLEWITVGSFREMELVAMGAFVDPQRHPGLGASVPGDLLRLLGGLVGVLLQAHLDEAKVVARYRAAVPLLVVRILPSGHSLDAADLIALVHPSTSARRLPPYSVVTA